MKVAILSETEADEASVRVLASAILRVNLELQKDPIRLRSRGWGAVSSNLTTFFKAVHYNHPDTEGPLVVVDSDETPIHTTDHELADFQDAGCRYCKLHRLIRDVRRAVGPRPNGSPLKVAIGIAVPAIEAWFQCGIDVHSTEARFARENKARLYQLRRDLKRACYGHPSPPEAILVPKCIEHSQRLALNIDLLERHFPNGFGALQRSLAQW